MSSKRNWISTIDSSTVESVHKNTSGRASRFDYGTTFSGGKHIAVGIKRPSVINTVMTIKAGIFFKNVFDIIVLVMHKIGGFTGLPLGIKTSKKENTQPYKD